MEPQIRYVRTSDGVSIAYFSIGDGAPLVMLPYIPFSNVQTEFAEWPLHRRLAANRRVIRYDNRGSGLSQRGVVDFSLDALARDVEAVVDRLELHTFALYAEMNAARLAVRYAASHPERVAQMILWAPSVRSNDTHGLPRRNAIDSLMDDWELWTETFAHSAMGFPAGEQARTWARHMRACMDADDARRYWLVDRHDDVSSLLSRVSAPTLVMHPANAVFAPLEWGKELAAGIPDAVLRVVPVAELWSDAVEDIIVAAVNEFLGGPELPPPGPPAAVAQPRGTAIILFTDIADSTAITERLGDAAFRDHARALDGALRTIITNNGGTPIDGKLLGDGVLATFPAASQAIAAARACDAACADTPLKLHLGIHAGDVIRESNNVFGGAVNIASRICALSAPGEILVSATVRDLARTSAGVSFDDRGEQELKGVSEPVRVFAVRPQS